MIPLTITHSYFYHFNTILLMQRAFPPSLSLKWLFFTLKKKNQSTIYWVTIMDYCHHLALVWFLPASATLLHNISVYNWNGKFSIQTTRTGLKKGELKLSNCVFILEGGLPFKVIHFIQSQRVPGLLLSLSLLIDNTMEIKYLQSPPLLIFNKLHSNVLQLKCFWSFKYLCT